MILILINKNNNMAKKGGKKHKRGNKSSFSTKFPKKKFEYDDYAYVLNMNGGQHCQLVMSDGNNCQGVMRGSLKKKHIFVKKETYVFVQRRDFQSNKVDITFCYDNGQVSELMSDPNFKALYNTIQSTQDKYNGIDDDNIDNKEVIVNKEIDIEGEDEDFYSMMNRIEDDVINVDDI